MLSKLPDTAPVDDSAAAPATAPVAVSAAQETAPEASTPVVNTSVQLTQVRYSDRLSLEGAGPDLHAVQVQRARRLLHQPGDRAAEGSEVQLGDSAQRHREVQARRAPDALRGRAEEGAGDAHVVVVGRADVHHQVGGRAQRYRQPKE